MPIPILEIYREATDEFAWRKYYLKRRGTKKHKPLMNIVASATGYNKKQALHAVIQKSVCPGWNLDWKNGIATCITIPSIRSRKYELHKIILIDNSIKKQQLKKT